MARDEDPSRSAANVAVALGVAPWPCDMGANIGPTVPLCELGPSLNRPFQVSAVRRLVA